MARIEFTAGDRQEFEEKFLELEKRSIKSVIYKTLEDDKKAKNS